MTARLVAWLILFSATTVTAGAGQVNWRAKVAGTKLLSTGAPIGASFIFELGAFSNNFIPTQENFSSWRDHFISLDSTEYNPNSGIFAASTQLATNASPFGIGQPGYIWGNGSSGETILLTASTWVWPGAGGAPGFATNFFTADPATTAVVGSISNEEGAAAHLMTERPGAVVPPAYTAWLANFFTNDELDNPTISGSFADADSDGNLNLQEFAQGTDPRDPGSSLPLEISKDGDVTTLFLQANVREEVVISVESSETLRGWSMDEAFVSEQSVGIAQFRGQSENRFFRLRFSF